MRPHAMPLPRAIQALRDRTSMYLLVVNYDTVVAFIEGFNHGVDGAFLRGFREWLLPRVRCDWHNMHWPVLVLSLAFPDEELAWPSLRSPERDPHSIRVLFEALDRYCDETGVDLGDRDV
jgi:hypothetical protein